MNESKRELKKQKICAAITELRSTQTIFIVSIFIIFLFSWCFFLLFHRRVSILMMQHKRKRNVIRINENKKMKEETEKQTTSVGSEKNKNRFRLQNVKKNEMKRRKKERHAEKWKICWDFRERMKITKEEIVLFNVVD